MKCTTNIFSQILQIIPKASFSQLVYASGAERHAKGFSSWDQLVAMLFCQFAQAKSLRIASEALATIIAPAWSKIEALIQNTG